MSASLFSSIVPALLAPWQQRRNAGSLWGTGLVVFMILLGPAAVFLVSVLTQMGVDVFGVGGVKDPAQLAAEMRHSAATVGMFSLSTLVLAAWALTVYNLMDQNRPVLARLVPAHAPRLRVALVAGWAVSVALITLFIGVRFAMPLLTAAIAGPVLALLALSVRWPALWALGMFAPVIREGVRMWPGFQPLVAGLRVQWSAQPVAIAVTLAGASVVILVGMIQSGGRHHIASDEARRNRVKRFQMRATGAQPVVAGRRSAFDRLMSSAYFAWWRRVLARPRSSVSSRLMLGLGPGAHWTNILTAVLFCGALMALAPIVVYLLSLLSPSLFHDFVPLMVLGASVGLVPGLMGNTLQVHARLQQTRREQALLLLLPGVPRGAALSRGLAWQFTGQFAIALGGALLLGWSLGQIRWVVPNTPLLPVMGRLMGLFAIGGLPLAVTQWRRWSRAKSATSLGAVMPLVVMALVMGLAALGTDQAWWTDAGAALIALAVTVALCALRWWRMGREPEALPIGRLA